MRPPGVWALATLFSRLDQKEMSNEFWFKLSAAPVLATWNGVLAADGLFTYLTNPLQNLTPTQIKFVGVNLLVNDGTGTIGFQGYGTVGGTVSGGYLPEDVSVIVQKDTASFMKGETGRWYFSGVPDAYANGSYLSVLGETTWLAQAPSLLSTFVDQTITYTPAHFSPKNNTLNAIVAIGAVPLLGTRRRRRFRF